MPKRSRLYRGGVMIITLLILMAIMLGFTIVGISTATREQQGFIESDFEMTADYAATACAETAIDRLGRDEAYVGNETISLEAGISCTIHPIVSSSPWIIDASSDVSGRVSRYRVTLSSRNPVDILSWEKVASF